MLAILSMIFIRLLILFFLTGTCVASDFLTNQLYSYEEYGLNGLKEYTNGNVDVDLEDEFGQTLLMLAVENNYSELVVYLISQGANVNRRSKLGTTPLMYAVSNRCYSQLVSYLIDSGSDIDAEDATGRTPLMEAAIFGDMSCVKTLVKNGARLDAVDELGDTVVHAAIYGENIDIIKYLNEQKVDLDKPNKFGVTPLMIASSAGKLKIVAFLLSEGADASKIKGVRLD